MAAEDLLKRIDLVAPQDGRVFQQAVHTIGGVIQAGEVLMLVVPDADELIIEAKLAPQDIDQIHIGQPAVVQFAAFNRRTTPELNGEVIGIGADITQDDKRNEAFYAVRIRISDKEMARLEGPAANGRHAGRGLHQDLAAHGGVVSDEAAPRAARPRVPRTMISQVGAAFFSSGDRSSLPDEVRETLTSRRCCQEACGRRRADRQAQRLTRPGRQR